MVLLVMLGSAALVWATLIAIGLWKTRSGVMYINLSKGS